MSPSLAHLAKLHAASTPGPWKVDDSPRDWLADCEDARDENDEVRADFPHPCWLEGPNWQEHYDSNWFSEEDAAAIVALHNTFPDLLAELQAAEALRDAVADVRSFGYLAGQCGPICASCTRGLDADHFEHEAGCEWAELDKALAAYFDARRKREEGE